MKEGRKMATFLNPKLRQLVEQATGAGACMCWTCSSCDSECPVEIATNRLRPQRIVRYANLGMFEDLIALPEIWYCLSCRRCNRACPNLVTPETLIQYARTEALLRGVVSWELHAQHALLMRRVQRVRWHAARACRSGRAPDIDAERWRQWLETPVSEADGGAIPSTLLFQSAGLSKSAAACFTCGECSSTCPVACERSAFDPRTLFRLANLGLRAELLKTPSLWLCVQCGRCTDACSQGVDGCGLIADLRSAALADNEVDAGFPLRFAEAQKPIYQQLLDEIDRLLESARFVGTPQKEFA
jgi:heterodisulfide reductase subunit C